MNLEQLQAIVITALEDIKAENIRVLNTDHFSSIAHLMIVATGQSTRQTRALAENVRKKLTEYGIKAGAIEGYSVGEWVLLDLGDIIVHVMTPATRAYYALEELWTMN